MKEKDSDNGSDKDYEGGNREQYYDATDKPMVQEVSKGKMINVPTS